MFSNNSLFPFSKFNYSSYFVPKNSGISPLYKMAFLWSGKDQNDSIYYQNALNFPDNSFQYGPMSSAVGQAAFENRWNNKVWKICKNEIEAYQRWWECNNGFNCDCDTIHTPDNSVLNTVLTWPGNGDTLNGETFQIAPFIDKNLDGIYNPADGDLPKIKGDCATFYVVNLIEEQQGTTVPISTGLELHVMLYQVASSDHLNDATFMDVLLNHRGTFDFESFVWGAYVDGDLGNYSDDHFGSDSLNSLIYFYNGDILDESDGGRIGYGENPPAFGVAAINERMGSCLMYKSYSNSSDTTILGEQISSNELNWKRLNGETSEFVNQYGQPVKFMYSGDPSNEDEWSCTSIGYPVGDRRGQFGHLPRSFRFGDQHLYSYVFAYERGGQSNLENASLLRNRIPFYVEAYNQIENQFNENEIQKIDKDFTCYFSMFPNPCNNKLTIRFLQDFLIGSNCKITSLNGEFLNDIQLSELTNEIDVSQFRPGFYLLIFNLGGNKIVKKLFVQN